MYADDTAISLADTNNDDLKDSILSTIHSLSSWLIDNKLKLNVNKCKILHYQDGDTLGSINYDGINIDVLKEFTFLGFIFDNKLNFKSHINNLVTKLSKINYFLKKSSFSLSIKNLRMLYNAFFLSNLMYGTELWGNNFVTNLKPIELVQKRAIRIINKHIFINNRLTHTTPLFIKCKCIKFIDIIDLRNMLFMYQVYYKKLPLNSLDNFSMCNS